MISFKATLVVLLVSLFVGCYEPLWNSVVQSVYKYENKNIKVFVGGASTGIGEQMAYEYARRGAHVALLSRRETVLKSVAKKCKALGAASTVIVTEDVSLGPSASKRALEKALHSPSFGGELDVLVLNHIIGMWDWWLPGNLLEKSADISAGNLNLLGSPNQNGNGVGGGFAFVEKMFQVNVFSYIYLATMAMPALTRSKGRLVVVSSGAGKMGLPKVAPYSATKFALHGFFDSLRIELDYKDIPVSLTMAVLGNIDTENNRENTKGDLQHIDRAPADECAKAIISAAGARQREVVYPYSQGLHIITKLRPWSMWLVDQILTKFAL